LLLQRLSSAADFDRHDSVVKADTSPQISSDVKSWTSDLLCHRNCEGSLEAPDGVWNSEQLPSSETAVKRQLDLNIVLSNYIKHRLEGQDGD